MSYKAKFIFEIVGDSNPRYKLELKLPFVPLEESCIYRKGKLINLGPFAWVHYIYNEDIFVCQMPSLTPAHSLHMVEVMETLKAEGWTRID